MKHLAVTLTTINIPYVLNDLLKIIKKKIIMTWLLI